MILPKDILQIDATILAGLLILLTIISLSDDTNLNDLEIQLIENAKKTEEAATGLTLEINQKQENILDYEQEIIEFQNDLDSLLTDKEIDTRIHEINNEIKKLKNDYSRTEQKDILSEIQSLENEERELWTERSIGEKKRLGPLLDKLASLNNTIVDIREEIKQLQNTRNSIVSQSLTELNSIKENIQSAIKNQKEIDQSSFLKKPKDWVYFVGSPFAFSAMLALLLSGYEKPTTEKRYRLAWYGSLGSMGSGFAYLLFIFFTIGSS